MSQIGEPSSIQRQLADEVDAGLLDLIKNGRELLDAEGNPVVDSKGVPVRKRASAQDYMAALRRLQMLGLKSQGINPNSPVEQIVGELSAQGFRFDGHPVPDLDLDGDDAASAAG